MKLAKIEFVELREVWKHEALDFTNWLAEPENLELLSDEIGIEISLIKTEADVGKFSVDILAEETNTGKKIIIENQLETTDHDHLGKLITYASGMDAEFMVWIVKSVQEEHRQAIDWLNEHTNSDINFFAIQLELWKIADSPPAPKFHIVAKPNDWAKAVKEMTARTELTETQLLQLDFWTEFKKYAETNNGKIKLQKAHAQNWYEVSIGTSNAYLSLTLNSQKHEMGCELYIPKSPLLFQELEAIKEKIETELNEHLDWQELPGKKASRIKSSAHFDLSEEINWPNAHAWLLNQTTKFRAVFGRQIKMISKKL
ncbi:MAG: DUF4268 domain-containing protein [Planctomycetaceae bacterium]|nr:DUF4268 domain-containing protein [Planctomycetaceae bacterium]